MPRKYPFQNKKVEAIFKAFPPLFRKQITLLREKIFRIAAATDGVGPLTETLKWDSPSYLTSESGSGTTIRIDRHAGRPTKYGIYVHCQSDVINQFRDQTGARLDYDGNRGIVLDIKDETQPDEIDLFIRLALTYHLRKKKRTKKEILEARRERRIVEY